MKVLLLSHIQPPAVDGGSRIIAKIGEYFQTHGHQTQFIASNCYSTDDFAVPRKQHTPTGIPVVTIFHRPLKFISRIFPIFKVFAIGPIFAFFPIPKFKPDIIIAGPFPTTISIYARIISLFTGAKLILIPCFHENDSDFHNPLLIDTLKHSLVCTLSDYERKLLKSTANIFTLRAGIDKSFIADKPFSSKSQNILFLGNFSAHKRVELLINAYEKLLPKYPELTLTIAGQKTLYWPKIENKIKLKINIITSGYTQTQLKQLLQQSTIVVLPSIHESFGLVFIEAMSQFRPVVGADIPPVKELLELINGGLTFKTDDLASLISTIDRLLKQPRLRLELAANGHNYVEQHLTWDKIGDKLCQKISLL